MSIRSLCTPRQSVFSLDRRATTLNLDSCWAVEESPPDDIPNALRNWEALAPEERWWLFTMAVATTGQALKKGVGWRKALRAALADNPFVKGEGMSPKARRELLAHSQLLLPL